MRRNRGSITRLAGMALATLAIGASGTVAAQSRSDIHRDAATRNVGNDPFMMEYARAFYCNLADDNNAIVLAAREWNYPTRSGSSAEYRIPTTQIFDDVWFVGNHYVGQYLIKTADGLVQVDAANTASESQTYNYPAMLELGLSETYPLRGVLLTHGHGDHDGGATWLKENLNPEIFLGGADNASNTKPYFPTPIDSADLSLRQMSIGGKSFWVLSTPGHTAGSTSAVVEVLDHGKPVRVLINGGQSMSSSSIPAVASYLTSIERTYDVVKALNVEGVMTPHIYWDGEGEKMREILAGGRTVPSQHVYGHDSVVRQMVVARECSAAWLSRLDTTAVLPIWRYNKLEWLETKPTISKVAARLTNGWGPLAEQMVTFTVEGSGQSCTAKTDADGLASCRVPKVLRRADRITASYAGAQGSEFVDLPANASLQFCRGPGCN